MGEDFFKQILENSNDEIYVTDKEGYAIYCNEVFENNYGISKEDIIGRPTSYLFENGYTNGPSPIYQVIRDGKRVSSRQKTITGKELIITAIPILDRQGKLVYIMENCRDITQLENIKTSLKSANSIVNIVNKEEKSFLGKNSQAIFIKGDMLKKPLAIIDKLRWASPNILITGESGTGKTLLAKYIHEQGENPTGPFITVNSMSFAENLFESELFGYVSGSFTGASREGKVGLVELANGGSLFFDEIGEVNHNIQVKLLELIQEKKYKPVGSNAYKSANIRIISATNADLEEKIKAKELREDFFYRLAVININIEPLRKFPEDINRLADFFLEKYNEKYSESKSYSQEVRDSFINYPWPGNIRELQYIIENLVLTSSQDRIALEDLPAKLLDQGQSQEFSLDRALEKVERDYIHLAWRTNTSSYKVADFLKISQSRASRLTKKYNKF